MITVREYAQQTVGVFGLGKAGQAAIDALLTGKAHIVAWDDGEKNPAFAREGITLQPIADWPWQALKALVLSPGVPLTHPKPHAVVEMAKKHGVPVIGEVELLYRAQPDATYIGITGTNGKSTTTSLIAHILAQAGKKVEVGGNLGVPALALQPLGKDGIYVLEMSSYQLDLMRTVRFNVAVFLNVTPDHLDRHGDMDGYVAAKRHIFDRQQAGDVAVVAVDDDYTRGIRDWALGIGGSKVVEISAEQVPADGVYVEQGVLHDTSLPMPDAQSLIPIQTLTGRHNWQNAAAAYAACRACGVAPEVIYQAMKSFGGLRHRLQLAATVNGVRFINDSKATNADATANALAPYKHIYWIAGGRPKAGGIASLAEFFPQIAHAFLIGEAEEEFARTLEGNVPFTRCRILQVAVEKAAAMAFASGESEPVVLLSPACASWDQWKSFEARGDAFCAMAEALAAGGGGKRHAV